MSVDLPVEAYRRAVSGVYAYRNEGIEAEVEKHLGCAVDGAERSRAIGHVHDGKVTILIESDWKQPTRA